MIYVRHNGTEKEDSANNKEQRSFLAKCSSRFLEDMPKKLPLACLEDQKIDIILERSEPPPPVHVSKVQPKKLQPKKKPSSTAADPKEKEIAPPQTETMASALKPCSITIAPKTTDVDAEKLNMMKKATGGEKKRSRSKSLILP